jgi:6-phospho-beta-glucosidase
MKIALIGGAGVRTPLLVHGLTTSDVPIDEICLFDPDAERLAIIAALARDRGTRGRIRTSASVTDCVDGASFVFTSIRVGGIDARARDERISLEHGIVGQETVGPGGFAMALRTIGPMVAYAEEIQRRARDAWIVNFTNPVGIITEAVRTATGARIIGICDTPTELFHEAAHALDVPAAECYFDYFGLNHLGWIREVYHRGAPILARLWTEPGRLSRVYRNALFAPEFLKSLRLLPTEYVYYYYSPREAYEHVRRAGTSRGGVIADLNRRLFADLASAGTDRLRVYEDYLAKRDAGYMQLETGAAAPRRPSPWAALTGYDKIALSVMRGIYHNTGDIIPLNVSNRGNMPELLDTDVVEVPCVVNANGALPLHVGRIPEQVRPLLEAVKHYERLTVRAGLTSNPEDARAALAANPLVGDAAGGLYDALVGGAT